MRRSHFVLYSSLLAALAVPLCCDKAYAYIDPGTGSYILQIVIAGAVGAAFTLKLFWRRLRLLISRVISKRKDCGEDRPPDKDE